MAKIKKNEDIINLPFMTGLYIFAKSLRKKRYNRVKCGSCKKIF